jgi:hypothetical protein
VVTPEPALSELPAELDSELPEELDSEPPEELDSGVLEELDPLSEPELPELPDEELPLPLSVAVEPLSSAPEDVDGACVVDLCVTAGLDAT